MSHFAHIDPLTQHAGVIRAENAAAALQHAAKDFATARGAAALLLAAVVAAMLVVANQVIDTWTEGHLLAAWMVMWLVAFTGLALLSAPTRRAAMALRAAIQARAERRRLAAQDDRTWQVALSDPRIMVELNHAMGVSAVDDLRSYR